MLNWTISVTLHKLNILQLVHEHCKKETISGLYSTCPFFLYLTYPWFRLGTYCCNLQVGRYVRSRRGKERNITKRFGFSAARGCVWKLFLLNFVHLVLKFRQSSRWTDNTSFLLDNKRNLECWNVSLMENVR